jgi:polysaccharide biosynthesis/export protein
MIHKYILLFSLSALTGQSLNNNALKNDLLKKVGLTEQQAKQIAKQNGIIGDPGFDSNISKPGISTDNKDIEKTQMEVIELFDAEKSNLKNKSKPVLVESIVSEDINDSYKKNEMQKQEGEIQKEILDIDPSTTATNFFGYNVFKGDPGLFQQSYNESVDPNYVIGPGDEVVIMLWGETESLEEYVVSKDGYLFIKNIGQVFVNGITLQKLEKKLSKLLVKVYSTLSPVSGSPTTFFDLSLGSQVLRPTRIFALGEIDQPGAYAVKSSTSLFTSLYYFGGPNNKGSLREISLVRNGKNIAKIDFYDFLMTGNKIDDVRLQRDDIIFISSRKKTISVKGEINRPAIYELKEKEGLKEILKFSGGVNATTYMKRIQIDRIIPPEARNNMGIDRTLIDVPLSEYLNSSENFILEDGDIIEFFTISDLRQNTITIGGAVNRPGSYDLGKGLKISELIQKADGLLGDVFMERADILRVNGDGTESQLDINLKAALNGDSKHDVSLLSNDVITIYRLSEMLYKTDVSISGHVQTPLTMPFRDGMQVIDLIFLAGGFQNDDHLKNTYFERAELSRYDDKYLNQYIIPFRLDSVLAGESIAQMELKMGDNIKIYSKEEVFGEIRKEVTVEGFVKRPGPYTLYKEMKLRDLLFMAGGFQDSTHLNSTFIHRADIVRLNDNSNMKKIIPFILSDVLDIDKNFNPYLKEGDIIRIYSSAMFDYVPNVTIQGVIKKPGVYELKEGMNLRDILLESGGVETDIFRYRVEIARIDPADINESNFAEIITVDLDNNQDMYRIDNITNKKSIKLLQKITMPLQPYDLITVRPDPYFKTQSTVSISGLVYYPGDYVIESPNERVSDIIERAGGLRPDAYPQASTLTRNGELIGISFEKIIRRPNSEVNFEVNEGDVITIGSRPNLVIIAGEVNSPGNYQFFKGQRINDYVKIAGGFTRDASRFSTFVSYPDGSTQKVGLLSLSPKVIDGSIITVGREEEVERFNFTEYVTSLTTIWADITQAYLMVVLALRN